MVFNQVSICFDIVALKVFYASNWHSYPQACLLLVLVPLALPQLLQSRLPQEPIEKPELWVWGRLVTV